MKTLVLLLSLLYPHHLLAEVDVSNTVQYVQLKDAYENLLDLYHKKEVPDVNITKFTLGLRNKNPMCVTGKGWLGQINSKNTIAVFETYEHGIRAGYLTLRKYHYKYKINTVEKLIKRYTKTDHKSYISFLCSNLKVKPNQHIDILDRIVPIMKSIIIMENGYNPFPESYFIPYYR